MERWQQVEEIFHEALQRDPAKRDAYLREACGSDAVLHKEIGDLIAHHEPGSGFEPWAADAAAQLIAAPASLQPGQRLGPSASIHSWPLAAWVRYIGQRTRGSTDRWPSRSAPVGSVNDSLRKPR